MKLNTEKYINTLKAVRSKINKELNTIKQIEGDRDVQESCFCPTILYNLSNVTTEKYYPFNFSIFSKEKLSDDEYTLIKNLKRRNK